MSDRCAHGLRGLRALSGWWLVLWLVPNLAGCGDDDVRRGGEGESCTSADNCESGLSCIAQVCTAEADGGGGDDRGPGASCGARRDCAAGLACIANACTAQTNGMASGARFSGRGESCQASNDCQGELVCQAYVCSEVTLMLDRTAKTCHRVECDAAEDCCKAFVRNPNCDTYEQNCKTDPVFCATYRSLCLCSLDCVDQLCVAAAPGCMEDAECTSQQTPFCVDQRCRQCASDGDCPGVDAQCVEGACMAACTIDENCPALHTCVDKACVETGCESDRECAFLTMNARGMCHEAKCRVPCDDDVDCSGSGPNSPNLFQICDQGECAFVGCESDAECRALFGLESTTDGVRAVCE